MRKQPIVILLPPPRCSRADQPIPDSEVLFNILAPGVIEQQYAPSKTVTGPNPLEMPGQQTIRLGMSEWQIDFGYTVGF